MGSSGIKPPPRPEDKNNKKPGGPYMAPGGHLLPSHHCHCPPCRGKRAGLARGSCVSR